MVDKFNKLRLLKIWEILNDETNEDKHLKSIDLIEKLSKLDIACDRKTLYSDINTLNNYGYEVMCERKSCNEYYVIDRKFNVSEIRILIDAVQAASFITPKKTEIFIEKIASLAGTFGGQIIKDNTVAFNTTKNINESIYYNIDFISKAISNDKKIEFEYFDYDLNHQRVYRKNNKKYLVNPYATIFSNDNYYLICYDDKHDGMAHYRIDRMDKVRITEENIIKRSDIEKFDLKKHKKQLFGMFSGEVQEIAFVADNMLIDAIFDKFGEEVKLKKYDENKFTFSASVQISEQFFGWCLSFGNNLKVISPSEAVEKLKLYLEKLKV